MSAVVTYVIAKKTKTYCTQSSFGERGVWEVLMQTIAQQTYTRWWQQKEQRALWILWRYRAATPIKTHLTLGLQCKSGARVGQKRTDLYGRAAPRQLARCSKWVQVFDASSKVFAELVESVCSLRLADEGLNNWVWLRLARLDALCNNNVPALPCPALLSCPPREAWQSQPWPQPNDSHTSQNSNSFRQCSEIEIFSQAEEDWAWWKAKLERSGGLCGAAKWPLL